MKRFSQGGNSPSPKQLFWDTDNDELDDFHFAASSPPSPGSGLPTFSQGSSLPSQPFRELPFSGISASGSSSLEAGSILGKGSKIEFKENDYKMIEQIGGDIKFHQT